VPRYHSAVGADMVEDGDEVVDVGGHREWSSDTGALASAAQIGSQNRNPLAQVAGYGRPRTVRPCDAVGGQNDRHPGRAGRRTGHTYVQRAARNWYCERGMKRLGHAAQPVIPLSKKAA
jgi:hypothetical protein